MEEKDWWMKEQNCGIWPRTIQAEETTVVGWLLYSTRDMDLRALTSAINHDTQGTVGLRYRIIGLGRPGSIPEDQRVKAVHVEVDKADACYMRRTLFQIFGTGSHETYPLGIRLRLVPELSEWRNRPSSMQHAARASQWT